MKMTMKYKEIIQKFSYQYFVKLLNIIRLTYNSVHSYGSPKNSLIKGLNCTTLIIAIIHGTKIFQDCTCPAGRVAYNFHSSFKHMHLSFKSVCNKEHKGVICNTTSSSNSSQSTRPVGRVLGEELLVLSRTSGCV